MFKTLGSISTTCSGTTVLKHIVYTRKKLITQLFSLPVLLQDYFIIRKTSDIKSFNSFLSCFSLSFFIKALNSILASSFESLPFWILGLWLAISSLNSAGNSLKRTSKGKSSNSTLFSVSSIRYSIPPGG